METTYNVPPSSADWYFCAIVALHNDETDYFDGYATGPRPTLDMWLASLACETHVWMGGMLRLRDEDVAAVAAVRHVDCETCGVTYGQAWHPPFRVLEWTTKATPQGAYSHLHCPTSDDEWAR